MAEIEKEVGANRKNILHSPIAITISIIVIVICIILVLIPYIANTASQKSLEEEKCLFEESFADCVAIQFIDQALMISLKNTGESDTIIASATVQSSACSQTTTVSFGNEYWTSNEDKTFIFSGCKERKGTQLQGRVEITYIANIDGVTRTAVGDIAVTAQ